MAVAVAHVVAFECAMADAHVCGCDSWMWFDTRVYGAMADGRGWRPRCMAVAVGSGWCPRFCRG